MTSIMVLRFAPEAEAAKRPPPPLPRPGLHSNPLVVAGVEEQNTGNYVGTPDLRDRFAARTGRKYCKPGPHNFDYGTGLGGRSFSATLDVNRFCHQGSRLSEVSVSTDHRLYGIYNFYMKFDHESIQKSYYNYRGRGSYSGYFVRAKFYFLYCYEPTRNACPKTYILYIRSYVHADGTSSTFKTFIG